jgi:hypothetical protein
VLVREEVPNSDRRNCYNFANPRVKPDVFKAGHYEVIYNEIRQSQNYVYSRLVMYFALVILLFFESPYPVKYEAGGQPDGET